jgi:acetyl-CoA carboxylase biotin carboxylase subunit
VYAEDPDNNFMPAPGRINFLRVPAGAGIRDDGGVEAGAEVSIYYDPMISKLAAWGRTRNEAIDRLRRALDEYTVGGIKTTLPFFRRIVRDEDFINGRLDTGFIERFFDRQKRAVSEAEAPETNALEETLRRRDIAGVAAVLAQTSIIAATPAQASPTADSQLPRQQSAWRLAGRAALHNSRR